MGVAVCLEFMRISFVLTGGILVVCLPIIASISSHLVCICCSGEISVTIKSNLASGYILGEEFLETSYYHGLVES